MGLNYNWCNLTRITHFSNHRLPLDLIVNNILCLVINILNIALMSYQKSPFYSLKLNALSLQFQSTRSLSNLIFFSMASPFPPQDT